MSDHKLPATRGPLTQAQILKKMAGGHAVFSPSGAEMSTACAESIIINTLEEDEPNIHSATGTVAHWLAEKWLKTGFKPVKWLGRTRTVGGFTIDIDEEMMQFVGDFVRYCKRLAKRSDESFTERRVDISHLTPIPKQGGTLDYGGMGPGWLEIVDLKYGMEAVLVFDPITGKPNKQLCIYASGVIEEFDWLYSFEKITITIVQPRLMGGTTSFTMTRAELEAEVTSIKEKWAYNWANPNSRTPTLKGCRWCAARRSCPALYVFMADQMADVFRNHDDDEDEDVIDAEYEEIPAERIESANAVILDEFAESPWPKLPKPAELSTRAMEKLLRYRKLFEQFFSSLQGELLTRAISDEEELLWWKLVMTSSRRAWVDDEQHIVDVLTGKGLKKQFIYKTVMLSPAEMERQLHTRLKMPLAQAKRLLAEAGLAVQPPGQKTLAQKSDRRKALPKETDVFRNHDDLDTE